METRVAVISIIVEKPDQIEALNHLLHEYSACIIGRMGLPYREKNINVICVALDALQNTINALTGQLGKLDGITAKVAFSKH